MLRLRMVEVVGAAVVAFRSEADDAAAAFDGERRDAAAVVALFAVADEDDAEGNDCEKFTTRPSLLRLSRMPCLKASSVSLSCIERS